MAAKRTSPHPYCTDALQVRYEVDAKYFVIVNFLSVDNFTSDTRNDRENGGKETSMSYSINDEHIETSVATLPREKKHNSSSERKNERSLQAAPSRAVELQANKRNTTKQKIIPRHSGCLPHAKNTKLRVSQYSSCNNKAPTLRGRRRKCQLYYAPREYTLFPPQRKLETRSKPYTKPPFTPTSNNLITQYLFYIRTFVWQVRASAL